MHFLFKGIIVVFGLALVSCAPASLCPTVSQEEAKKSEIALADFAVNLFKNVSSKDESKNEALSPVSIALALALLESGADGKTRDELKRVLLEEYSSSEQVLPIYRALQEQLKLNEENVKLNIANGLFYQEKDLKLKSDYLNALDCFKIEKDGQVDFKQQLEQSRQKINKFISDKTNQKIPELFKKNYLKAEDRLVLANAVYFKASWKLSFTKTATKQDTFYKNGDEQQKQTVPFLQQTATHRHASTNDLDALELSYVNRDLALYVVLPKQRDGLRDLEKKLTGRQLRDILARLQQKEVKVQLPKFTVRSTVDLKNTLSQMGLQSLFNNQADFRRMSESQLQVNGGVHEAYISVDENGTEGAAATAFDMNLKAAVPGSPEEETVFKADHPFLYAVVHKQTGAVIFLGKVNSVEQPQE